MKTPYDCAVVGAGMVGAATALTLANLGLSVALIESQRPKSFSKEQPFDLRVSAISLGSEQLLTQLGAWQQLNAWRVCPYKRLGVWEDELAYTEFNASSIEKSHLGHIIENRLIQLALWQQLENHPNITFYCPEQLKTLVQHPNQVTLTLSEKTINAKLVVAADGANSKVRSLAQIGITGWQYQQSAMLIHVKTALSQQDITWQQFTPTGPMALLPLSGNNASLVWYHNNAEIKRLASLSNSQLAQEIATHFPKRLGQFDVVAKAAFPLTRRHANDYVKNRVVLLGDAAHTINPLAGQGVNLGFKDVKALQTVLAQAIGDGVAFDDPKTLQRYQKARYGDNLLMMTTMDALYSVFSNHNKALKFARNLGLFMANRAPLLKEKALAYACGL